MRRDKNYKLNSNTLILEQINVGIKILLRNEFLNLEIRSPKTFKSLFFCDFLSKTILIKVKNFEIYPLITNLPGKTDDKSVRHLNKKQVDMSSIISIFLTWFRCKVSEVFRTMRRSSQLPLC